MFVIGMGLLLFLSLLDVVVAALYPLNTYEDLKKGTYYLIALDTCILIIACAMIVYTLFD